MLRKVVYTLLLLSLPSLALYVQPNVHVGDCDWAVFGTPSYVVLHYKGYAYIIERTGSANTPMVIEIIDLMSGRLVNTTVVKLPVEQFADQYHEQVLLCPKEKRLMVVISSSYGSLVGATGYAVLDISNPSSPTLLHYVPATLRK